MTDPVTGPRDPAGAARWAEVKARFDALVDLDPADRESHIAALPDDIRDEVASLLAAADRVGARFSQGALPLTTPAQPGPSHDWLGHRIGPWLIVREIGHGGMGTVYEAHRADDQFRQRVALKMASRGTHADTLLGRFRHERQILAQLQHKNVATLLDGGITEDGLPYFVMEYVEGEPIDRWCAARQLGVRDRVALFRQVCAAVQYAHEHLIVHRDLKPGNILVTATGSVKLLDFGIAKLLDPAQADDVMLTQAGLTPMTTAYASPEQLRGDPVATSSDVYSLGVVLYELLAGRRPFDVPTPAAALAARATPAAPPSAVAGVHTRELRGDLDSIVLMALRWEGARRYGSAAQLGDDLQHYLRGEPVLARPDSTGYRIRRFVGRNRAAVVAGVFAVAALCTGTAVAWNRAVVARHERDLAVLEQKRTEGVKQFFQNLLGAANPAAIGMNATVVEAIDRAIPAIDTSFGGDLDIRAAIKNTLGSTLHDMFLFDRAKPLLEDALRLLETIDGGRPSRERADAMYNLAGVEDQIGDGARAESLYRASLAMYGRVSGDSLEIYHGYNNLGGALMHQGKTAEAAEIYRIAMERLLVLEPGNGSSHATARTNYGTALATLGRYVEAEPQLREALAYYRGQPRIDSFRVASVLQPLAGTLLFQEKYAEAETMAAEGWTLSGQVLGPRNAFTLAALRMLVNIQADAGRCEAALRNAETIIALRGHGLADSDPSVATAYLFAGSCRARLGQSAAAIRDARTGLALREAGFPADHWAVAQARSMAGEVLALAGPAHAAEAEALLRQGYDGMKRTLDPGHIRVRQGRDRLVRFYRAQGKTAEADALLRR